jgi:hypothetical protein
VPVFTATTVAPGSTPPPLSVTVPTSAVCEASCADALGAKTILTSRHKMKKIARSFIDRSFFLSFLAVSFWQALSRQSTHRSGTVNH